MVRLGRAARYDAIVTLNSAAPFQFQSASQRKQTSTPEARTETNRLIKLRCSIETLASKLLALGGRLKLKWPLRIEGPRWRHTGRPAQPYHLQTLLVAVPVPLALPSRARRLDVRRESSDWQNLRFACVSVAGRCIRSQCVDVSYSMKSGKSRGQFARESLLVKASRPE